MFGEVEFAFIDESGKHQILRASSKQDEVFNRTLQEYKNKHRLIHVGQRRVFRPHKLQNSLQLIKYLKYTMWNQISVWQ